MSKKLTKNLPDEFEVMGSEADTEVEDLEIMDDGLVENVRFVTEVLGVFQPNEAFDRKRSAANLELLNIVAQYLTEHPSQRFGQALKNLELATEDCALVEPTAQLNRAKAALRRLKHAR